MKALFSALVALLCALGHVTAQEKKMFCYYSSDARWRPSYGAFKPKDVDTNLCTHLIVAFAKVLPGGLGPNTRGDDKPGGLYQQCADLKKRNPNLRVLLAVGGWRVASEPFMAPIRDWNSMDRWARSATDFLRFHNLDGLDMDWEFPGVRGSGAGDKVKFTQFMERIQYHFRRDAAQTGREKMTLTLATAAGEYFISKAYETRKIHKHLDYMLLMTYNYHGLWDQNVGHHSSITPSRMDEGERTALCQSWTVQFWLDSGAPREKLILGLATYGMSFTLLDPSKTYLGANATGGGQAGKMTGEKGILAYFEVCENLRRGWQKAMIPEQRSPYAFGQGQWVGYDDVNSIAVKAQYINEIGLAGAFIWSVEMDDFTGKGCGQGKYPILRKISEIIRPGTPTAPRPTRRPTWRPPKPTVGPPPTRKPLPPVAPVAPVAPPARPPRPPGPFPSINKQDLPGDIEVSKPGFRCPPGKPFGRHADCHKYWECTPWGAEYERICSRGTSFHPLFACSHRAKDCPELPY